MSYHRGGQAGAVAVSYSTSPMAPHSPSRRYSSGATGTTTTSGIGSSSSKYSAFRPSGGASSILDQPTSFYTSSSTAGSSLRSNYISSEYRRSYCAPGRLVTVAELRIRGVIDTRDRRLSAVRCGKSKSRGPPVSSRLSEGQVDSCFLIQSRRYCASLR